MTGLEMSQVVAQLMHSMKIGPRAVLLAVACAYKAGAYGTDDDARKAFLSDCEKLFDKNTEFLSMDYDDVLDCLSQPSEKLKQYVAAQADNDQPQEDHGLS